VSLAGLCASVHEPVRESVSPLLHLNISGMHRLVLTKLIAINHHQVRNPHDVDDMSRLWGQMARSGGDGYSNL